MRKIRPLGLSVLFSLLLAACAGVSAQLVATPAPPTPNEASIAGTPLPGNLDQITFVEDNREYVIRQLIPRDGIAPIYNPEFTSADQAGFSDDELVMGVEINGDARAYPVGILRSREIVNDVIGGTPVLVTW